MCVNGICLIFSLLDAALTRSHFLLFDACLFFLLCSQSKKATMIIYKDILSGESQESNGGPLRKGAAEEQLCRGGSERETRESNEMMSVSIGNERRPLFQPSGLELYSSCSFATSKLLRSFSLAPSSSKSQRCDTSSMQPKWQKLESEKRAHQIAERKRKALLALSIGKETNQPLIRIPPCALSLLA